jgi:hypothetical protein
MPALTVADDKEFIVRIMQLALEHPAPYHLKQGQAHSGEDATGIALDKGVSVLSQSVDRSWGGQRHLRKVEYKNWLGQSIDSS